MSAFRLRSGWIALFAAMAAGPVAAQTPAETSPAEEIPWEDGPSVAQLGSIAQVKVPEGFRFAGRDGVRKFMELTQNPVSGKELGVLVSASGPESDPWFVIFEFNPIGYVKDDEKGKLDASAILSSLQAGNKRGNEERQKRGWSTLDLVGWSTQPRYDPITNNLTWAIRARSEGTEVINHSVRLLGRRGVMDADLVLSPSQIDSAVPAFNAILAEFSFLPGNKYAEWVRGDHVAEYGLTALVAGGVGAAAVKSGALGKLWKALVLGVIAVGAALKKVLASLFGSKDDRTEASAPTQ
jgi:uncharacterized membrane-anchored protein